MQQLVKKNFGISMNIPAEMQASKKAGNFIWISNNASSGMKNLILMKVKREERRGKANSDAFPVFFSTSSRISKAYQSFSSQPD